MTPMSPWYGLVASRELRQTRKTALVSPNGASTGHIERDERCSIHSEKPGSGHSVPAWWSARSTHLRGDCPSRASNRRRLYTRWSVIDTQGNEKDSEPLTVIFD